jgi:hypothetical protein
MIMSGCAAMDNSMASSAVDMPDDTPPSNDIAPPAGVTPPPAHDANGQ